MRRLRASSAIIFTTRYKQSSELQGTRSKVFSNQVTACSADIVLPAMFLQCHEVKCLPGSTLHPLSPPIFTLALLLSCLVMPNRTTTRKATAGIPVSKSWGQFPGLKNVLWERKTIAFYYKYQDKTKTNKGRINWKNELLN